MNRIGNISFCKNRENSVNGSKKVTQILEDAHFNATMHNPKIPAAQKVIIAKNRAIVDLFNKFLNLFRK